MVWILCIFLLFLSSCDQKPRETHYREIIIEAPNGQGIHWQVPQGWEETAGDSMRLATFHVIADPDAIDCSIISLSGPAGGLDANLERWMRQLGLQASDDRLKVLEGTAQMISTKDNLAAKVFDFAFVQSQANALDKTMMVAMIPLSTVTVFIKMTGSLESVQQNKDNFFKLLGSMTLQ